MSEEKKKIKKHPSEEKKNTDSLRRKEIRDEKKVISPLKFPKKPKLKKRVFVDNKELPATYNTTNLTLMVRDPYWIYAYWEIAPSSIEKLREKLGDVVDRCSYVLRMYDVTLKIFDGSNANHWFDIEVGPYTNNWYINLWCDNVTYCGEIGLRTPEGEFFPLARSNFVNVPRAGCSLSNETIWMEVKDDITSTPFVIKKEEQKQEKQEKEEQKRKEAWYKIFLTEDDIRAYYSRLFPLLRKVSSPRDRRKKERVDIEAGQEDILIGKRRIWSDLLASEVKRKEFIRRIILGASEELVTKAGASEFVQGGLGVSSEEKQEKQKEEKKREFFFEIGTELIVYGRTEPEAKVWLNGKEITLRKDGTFTLRFALSEGKIPLEFTAQSSDKGEERNIKTAVERSSTIYNP